jgi:hypothetical protein
MINNNKKEEMCCIPGSFNIIKMPVPPDLISRFNAVPTKNSIDFFNGNW